MNKQELTERIDRETFVYTFMEPETEDDITVEFKKGFNCACDNIKLLVEQKLDKPKKVVVSKFVADWIDKHKYSVDIIDLFSCFEYTSDLDKDEFIADKWEYSRELYDWLNDDADTLYKLCDALRYGYEVEKETLYFVKLLLVE